MKNRNIKKSVFSKNTSRKVIANKSHKFNNIYRNKLFVASSSLIIFLLMLPIFFNIKTSAEATYLDKVQTTWINGIGPSTIDQYSEIDNLDTSTDGEINFGGTPTSGETGWLISNVFDMGDKAFFGTVLIGTSGNGEARIQIRTDSNPDMSTATDWAECGLPIETGDDIYSSSCVGKGERYLEYKITLTNDTLPDDFSVTDITFKYNNDVADPYQGGLPSLSALSTKVRNSPADTFTWMQLNEDLGWFDDDSGLSGMKYCLINLLGETQWQFDECDPSVHPENYVGPIGSSATETSPDTFENNFSTPYGSAEWISDTYPIDNQRLTTNPLDARYIGSDMVGMYFVFVRAIDNVGNFESSNSYFISKNTTLPSGPAQNISSTNTVPGTNMFSFTWTSPLYSDNPLYELMGGNDEVAWLFVIFQGSTDEMSYCYAINKSPNPDDEDYVNNWTDVCTETDKGDISLPADNYGLKQGANTIYMASKNEAGIIIPMINPEDIFGEDGQGMDLISNYSQAEFNVETFSPDLPRNVEVVDISNRSTEVWRVVLSWVEPEDELIPVAKYKIYRSMDNVTWGESIGDTTSLSYIDTDPTLNNETKYYYQIKACDNADSCSVGVDAINVAAEIQEPGIIPDGRFTTPADLTSGPTADNIGTRKVTINWQTNRESDSKIYMSTSPNVSTVGVYSGGNSNQSFSHSIDLSELQQNTKYYYKVTWTDIDNNTGTSSEMSFTTLPAPSFSEVGFSDISISSSSVNFTVENANNVNVYYGKSESFGGSKTINTSSEKSSYSINLTDLDDGSKYFVKLNGFDADGNEYQGNIYSFTTLPRPRISNLRFQPVADASSNTTIVSWTTNVPASSELSYGIVGGGQIEVIDSKLVIEHEITISGLIDDNNYTATARSRDASGNLAVSEVMTFKTALDTRPPKISNINVDTSIKGSGAEARGQIVISWTTDEPATSQVGYGQGAPGNYSNKSSEDSRLSTEHVVIISDLSTSSIYQVQPLSKDKAANESKGTNQSAIIGRGSENVFTIIFNSLRKIFGIKG